MLDVTALPLERNDKEENAEQEVRRKEENRKRRMRCGNKEGRMRK